MRTRRKSAARGQSPAPDDARATAEAEESLRRLARALVACALEVHELATTAGGRKATTPGLDAHAPLYSRPRKRWGRAA